jgi:hypothetical protein
MPRAQPLLLRGLSTPDFVLVRRFCSSFRTTYGRVESRLELISRVSFATVCCLSSFLDFSESSLVALWFWASSGFCSTMLPASPRLSVGPTRLPVESYTGFLLCVTCLAARSGRDSELTLDSGSGCSCAKNSGVYCLPLVQRRGSRWFVISLVYRRAFPPLHRVFPPSPNHRPVLVTSVGSLKSLEYRGWLGLALFKLHIAISLWTNCTRNDSGNKPMDELHSAISLWTNCGCVAYGSLHSTNSCGSLHSNWFSRSSRAFTLEARSVYDVSLFRSVRAVHVQTRATTTAVVCPKRGRSIKNNFSAQLEDQHTV